MYENPITQDNIKKLSAYGYHFIEPREARLACGDLGRGALAEVDVIIAAVRGFLAGY
jgi:phosphopantothenoylcysteine decarboxylase/phosphopantothenoylcysteine decarboxylase/phosphopantothenate--cysteine ligase